jgi:hypothetical protein
VLRRTCACTRAADLGFWQRRRPLLQDHGPPAAVGDRFGGVAAVPVILEAVVGKRDGLAVDTRTAAVRDNASSMPGRSLVDVRLLPMKRTRRVGPGCVIGRGAGLQPAIGSPRSNPGANQLPRSIAGLKPCATSCYERAFIPPRSAASVRAPQPGAPAANTPPPR